MKTIATAKARHQDDSCGVSARTSAPILFMTLLLSACAYLPKAATPVVVEKPAVKEQPAEKKLPVIKEPPVVKAPPAADSQPAVTEEKPPARIPEIPPQKLLDHNIEED